MKEVMKEARAGLSMIADAVYTAKAMRKGRTVTTDADGNVWVRANRF